MTEKQYEQMINEIGNYIEEFLPDPSELTVVDGVKILYYKYKILQAEKEINNILSKDNV